MINAIIKAQGYSSELEQYTIRAELERTEESSVLVATHNVLGVKVVIKNIPSEFYNRKEASFAISEVNAQHRCQKSEYVLGILDSFEVDGYVYIVTKYEAGGDLADYAEARGQSNLTEVQAQRIFT